jgi:CBS domain-containing protein
MSKHATVPEALKVLTEHRILSVVVVDPEANNVALGCFSVMDIMNIILSHFSKEDFGSEDFEALIAKKENLNKRKIETCQEVAAIDTVWSVRNSATLLDVINVFVNHNVHRVIVTNANSQPVNIISQSRVMLLLRTLMDSIPKCKETVQDLGLLSRQIVSISEAKTAYEAFQLMKEKKLSALPVVDQEGRVTGCISADDIKHLGFEMKFFGILGHPISEYLKALKNLHIETIELSIPKPNVVNVQPTHTLCKVIRLVTFYEIHRVFVTEPQGRLLGVITLRDILKVLFEVAKPMKMGHLPSTNWTIERK